MSKKPSDRPRPPHRRIIGVKTRARYNEAFPGHEERIQAHTARIDRAFAEADPAQRIYSTAKGRRHVVVDLKLKKKCDKRADAREE